MTEKKTCGTCYHYEPTGDCAGECYRNPPVNDGNGETTIDKGGTVKKNRRACGEHIPK
ncbi:MAG: hypothetical protein ACYSUX_00370 [Planctomycetota bacterium]|jgi:hypothetical protein